MSAQPKLSIAWYSFACCEDSTIMFAELLNDYFFEFKKHFNVIDASVFAGKRDTDSPLDIAFVEGAANSPEHEEQMKKIRTRAKKVVAIGSCACTGMPSAHRNTFNQNQLTEINHLLTIFNFSDKVKKVADVIPIDAQVPGCPMDLDNFVKAVNGLLVEFGHAPLSISHKPQATSNTPNA
jgi:coenzyme F420-reducing hydrogenase gamma subunit